LFFFGCFVTLFFVVVDCEHIIVLDAVFEHEDSRIWVICAFCIRFDKGSDVVDETAPEGLIELLVGFVLAEVEDVIDVAECVLEMWLLCELSKGE